MHENIYFLIVFNIWDPRLLLRPLSSADIAIRNPVLSSGAGIRPMQPTRELCADHARKQPTWQNSLNMHFGIPGCNGENSAIACDRVRHPGSEHVHCPDQGNETECLREQRAFGLHRTEDAFSGAFPQYQCLDERSAMHIVCYVEIINMYWTPTSFCRLHYPGEHCTSVMASSADGKLWSFHCSRILESISAAI